MNTFLLALLLGLTIGGAFAFGIALGYWVICGILNLFNRQVQSPRQGTAQVLAPTPGGD